MRSSVSTGDAVARSTVCRGDQSVHGGCAKIVSGLDPIETHSVEGNERANRLVRPRPEKCDEMYMATLGSIDEMQPLGRRLFVCGANLSGPKGSVSRRNW